MILDERMVVEHVERLTLRELRVWLNEGLVRPAQGEQGPVFDELDIARLRLICDLKKDMMLPSDVLPVVLTLIDRMHAARRDLHLLAKAVDQQPLAVRNEIQEHFRALRDSGTDGETGRD